jgi:DNA replication protein DnaC
MLIEPTVQNLGKLKLHGMARALEHQRETPSLQSLSFDERFSLIVDSECLIRDNRRLNRMIKNAKMKTDASLENIDYRPTRSLDKRQIGGLSDCDWIVQGHHLIITGPTGAGKTWLACAFGNQAVRRGLPVMYRRLTRLLEEIQIARGDGSLPKLRAGMAKARLLILDDWGLTPPTTTHRQDLLEVVDDRTGTLSIAITSQLPVDQWHGYLGEPTIADAIMDRLVHSAHRIEITGESMRKLKSSTRQ